MEQSELLDREDDQRALTLQARLVKDRAKRSVGPERARLFGDSAAIYAKAAKLENASYPLINAASLSLLAGRPEQAAKLARKTLELLESDPASAETPYWLGATQAEALLVLGKLPEARSALRMAFAAAPQAWEDHAATIGQFQLICSETGCENDWLNALRPPRSLQFSGIMDLEQFDKTAQDQITQLLERENVGFGFGALAAGADIWIAEALVARNAELHVVLPCPADIFREKSVCAVDPAWGPRFDSLMERADHVDELDTASAPTPSAVRVSEAVSRGMAIHNARLLQSEPLSLAVQDQHLATDSPQKGNIRSLHLRTARRQNGEAPGFSIAETGASRAMFRQKGGSEVLLFRTPAQAWKAAQPIVQAGLSVIFDFQFTDDLFGESDDTARLEAIGDVALDGQVLASRAFAFALLSELPEILVEAMGEVRTASGFLPLYALVPTTGD